MGCNVSTPPANCTTCRPREQQPQQKQQAQQNAAEVDDPVTITPPVDTPRHQQSPRPEADTTTPNTSTVDADRSQPSVGRTLSRTPSRTASRSQSPRGIGSRTSSLFAFDSSALTGGGTQSEVSSGRRCNPWRAPPSMSPDPERCSNAHLPLPPGDCATPASQSPVSVALSMTSTSVSPAQYFDQVSMGTAEAGLYDELSDIYQETTDGQEGTEQENPAWWKVALEEARQALTRKQPPPLALSEAQ